MSPPHEFSQLQIFRAGPWVQARACISRAPTRVGPVVEISRTRASLMTRVALHSRGGLRRMGRWFNTPCYHPIADDEAQPHHSDLSHCSRSVQLQLQFESEVGMVWGLSTWTETMSDSSDLGTGRACDCESADRELSDDRPSANNQGQTPADSPPTAGVSFWQLLGSHENGQRCDACASLASFRFGGYLVAGRAPKARVRGDMELVIPPWMDLLP